MLVSIQDLRSIQERCDVGELVQRLDVSIDRLTVIWDTDTGSLRRIFKNLKQAISTRVDAFEIHDNVRDDVFALAKDLNEYDSINTFYNRKRLMVVPKSVVNEILGTEVA